MNCLKTVFSLALLTAALPGPTQTVTVTPDRCTMYRADCARLSARPVGLQACAATAKARSPATYDCPLDAPAVVATPPRSPSSSPLLESPAPSPATSAGVAYTGVTAAMWAEIDAQRAVFGDPNNCRAKVNAIPTTGTSITPSSGNAINNALASSNTVILRGGTYKISRTIKLGSKNLIGALGEEIIIDSSDVNEAVWMGSNGILANVKIMNAGNTGINFLGHNNLLYQVTVGRTGFDARHNSSGTAFAVWYGATNNCLVSVEAFDSYNEDGKGCSVCANGGNADGFRNSNGAYNNTFIDAHAYRNSDDGWDFWEGGGTFVYFSSAFDNGKTSGKPTADGNGFKLGRGNVRHHLYKSKAYNNKAHGFTINGNSTQPMLVQCDAFANGRSDYAGIMR